MSWFYPKSGTTVTVVSKSICLVKEQQIAAEYTGSNQYNHSERTLYSVRLKTNYSDGTTTNHPLTNFIREEEIANKVFDFYVKSKGEKTVNELLKEKTI